MHHPGGYTSGHTSGQFQLNRDTYRTRGTYRTRTRAAWSSRLSLAWYTGRPSGWSKYTEDTVCANMSSPNATSSAAKEPEADEMSPTLAAKHGDEVVRAARSALSWTRTGRCWFMKACRRGTSLGLTQYLVVDLARGVHSVGWRVLKGHMMWVWATFLCCTPTS